MHGRIPAARAELAFTEAARDVAMSRFLTEQQGIAAIDVSAAEAMHGFAIQALQRRGVNSRGRLGQIVLDQTNRIDASSTGMLDLSTLNL